MSGLVKLVERLGEPHSEKHFFDFGIAEADYVADFINNGGLTFRNNGVNYAIQYVSTGYGRAYIGAWVWFDGQDFDRDATSEVYDEDDFSDGELKRMYDKIIEIYDKD